MNPIIPADIGQETLLNHNRCIRFQPTQVTAMRVHVHKILGRALSLLLFHNQNFFFFITALPLPPCTIHDSFVCARGYTETVKVTEC